MLPAMMDISSLRSQYEERVSLLEAMDALATRMEASEDPAIFITPVDRAGLMRQAEALLDRAPKPNSLPLWGMPFAVKDNIDVAGLPTTAACPRFAYTPKRNAFVVERLVSAGAIVTGKTNLDQFATGLNGTRSPYGAPRCVFDAAYISGGSSSGSAVTVAAGLAVFALGTDTAGSGRVPAALNNIVGVKPTPGRISASGMVPACRSLDTISIFASCVNDGITVRRIAEGFDPTDPFSRVNRLVDLPTNLRVGVLRIEDRAFYGDRATPILYDAMVAALTTLGATPVAFDFAPFREAATLLYGGPWVAERLAGLEGFMRDHIDALDPSVRTIVEGAKAFSAVDAFQGRYELELLRRRTEESWAACDLLLLPTAPTTYTIASMMADPVRLNSHLGHYTNFANLLGLAAIAVPGGFTPNGLPFGVTLVGPGSSDDAIAALADKLHRASASGMGLARAPVPGLASPGPAVPDPALRHLVSSAPVSSSGTADVPDGGIEIAVVGAHLSGLPLNGDLVKLGGRFQRKSMTTSDYRLFALEGTVPRKPGLLRDPDFKGPGIETEIWSLSPEAFGRFVATIPSPLGIGRIAMRDGAMPSGFLCEPWATRGSREITAFGGWRYYIESLA